MVGKRMRQKNKDEKSEEWPVTRKRTRSLVAASAASVDAENEVAPQETRIKKPRKCPPTTATTATTTEEATEVIQVEIEKNEKIEPPPIVETLEQTPPQKEEDPAWLTDISPEWNIVNRKDMKSKIKGLSRAAPAKVHEWTTNVFKKVRNSRIYLITLWALSQRLNPEWKGVEEKKHIAAINQWLHDFSCRFQRFWVPSGGKVFIECDASLAKDALVSVFICQQKQRLELTLETQKTYDNENPIDILSCLKEVETNLRTAYKEMMNNMDVSGFTGERMLTYRACLDASVNRCKIILSNL